jgi:hypothetical protein
MSLFIRRLSVHPSVSVEQLVSHWTDFHEEVCDVLRNYVAYSGNSWKGADLIYFAAEA